MEGRYGRFLDIDLTEGETRDYQIPDEWLRKHVGGRGIAARILLEELKVGADALGPENILVFATGPMQGTGVAGAGRHLIAGKSPKTQAVNETYAGGFFGHELGSSGYDGLIIRGKSSRPVYITLVDGRGEVHDAQEVWGLSTLDAAKQIRMRHGDRLKVSSIGIAGENLVKYSCIISDGSRAAARPGFGAVMGSKNLKAVAVAGGIGKPVFDRAGLERQRAQFARDLLTPEKKALGKYGTPGNDGVVSKSDLGLLPTKNFRMGSFADAEKIGGARLNREMLAGRETCAGCPIRCKRVVRTEYKGSRVRTEYGGPEYETLAALGSYCLNSNLEAIALANQKCNAYGLDTISVGVVIACAMEASERGAISEEIPWGNPDVILRLIDEIASVRGFGAQLARGIDTLERDWGVDYAMHIKGQELPMQEPRARPSLAITYATTPRGGQHVEGIYDTYLERELLTPELGIRGPYQCESWDGKAHVSKVYEDLTSFLNSMVGCYFVMNAVGPNYNYPVLRDLLHKVTGQKLDAEDMIAVGERNYALLRMLACREGYTREDDCLPSRFSDTLLEGPIREPIPAEKLQSYIDEHYRLRGFDRHGPTEETLERLNLAELVEYRHQAERPRTTQQM